MPILEEKVEDDDPACEKGELDNPEGGPEKGDPECEKGEVDGDGREEDPEDRAKRECGERKPLKLIVKAVSLPDKKAKTVLQGLQDIYIQLKREGYPVQRLHTDRGKEFLNHDLNKWCLVREIEKTTTSADSPQESGRAEACIGSLKSRMRRLLKGAKMDVKFWPMAARYAAVRQWNELMPAAFGEEVWVPRRSWKRTQDPFGPTYEKARYLAVVKEVTSGHGILWEDGKIEVVSRIVRGVVEPEDRLLPEEAEPHHPRRRIRGKTNVGEERDKELGDLCTLRAVIEEETEAMDQDGGEVLGIPAVKIKEMKLAEEALVEEVMGEEEKQVLQTRIASHAEVIKNKEEWLPAIKAEVDSLLDGKQAVRRVTNEEARVLLGSPDYKVDIMPGKMVPTVKAPNGKKKCRIVICGNYAEGGGKDSDESLYAGGSDTISIRTITKYAAEQDWEAMVLDIKTAFLNAPLQEKETEGEPKKILLMKPPSILTPWLVQEG